jgi:transposase InsO family protein
MMYHLLKLEKIAISKATVHKYMQEMHLHSIARRNSKYNAPKSENVLFPNIISRDFNPSARNKVWCTDFTNLEYGGGTVRYNCTIIDLFDRSVVACLNSNLLNADLAINTLKRALLTHKVSKGLILHSDQGCQFTSKAFVEFCKQNHIQQSMSVAGCPYDNAPMERFFNTLKNEFTYHHRFMTAKEIDAGIIDYVFGWYNKKRPHTHNNGVPPLLAV